jgi:NAD(P)-dependent dehydrogenase (short-subunit alcohol dehydrogenase family)
MPTDGTMSADHLDGRVVVVTGAGRGIGREHALLMAASGARVVVNDVSGVEGSVGPAHLVVDEIRASGGEAVAAEGDVSSTADAERIIRTAIQEFGHLHCLVNNAGILRDRALVNTSDEEWDLAISVNLRGHFAPTRAAAKWWRERSKAGEQVDAAVVNTSSESGVFGNAGQGNYVAAKAAVAALTEVWHKELSRYGVRVNAILPRARTRLTENDQIQPREGKFDFWHPANVSPFVTYLASDLCTISGQVFLVGGGLVQRAAPWTLDEAWKIERRDRWTVADLADAIAELGDPTNVGRDTGYVK